MREELIGEGKKVYPIIFTVVIILYNNYRSEFSKISHCKVDISSRSARCSNIHAPCICSSIDNIFFKVLVG